jgi:predicted RNA-binding protein with PIN domain
MNTAMPYMIDGHNLIPKVRGLSLGSLDDELALIGQLQAFARISRQKIEIYFDKAAPGGAGTRRFGTLTAHFVRQGSSADDAIRVRLQRLGKEARNWKVVSSDRQVQAEVRSRCAQVVRSEDFAAQMEAAVNREQVNPQGNSGAVISPEEVDYWLEAFKPRKQGDKK